MKTKANGEEIYFELKSVAFLSDLMANLIVVSKLQAAGLRVKFPKNNKFFQVFKDKMLFLKGKSKGTDIFKITDVDFFGNLILGTASITANFRGISMDLMHYRMVHTGESTLIKMRNVKSALGIELLYGDA